MLATIISDHNGQILGMAYNQLVQGDKRIPNAAEIRAFPVGDGTATQPTANTPNGFECHTMEMPAHLIGRSFEELRDHAHVDFSGEYPVLRLRPNSRLPYARK
jgi:hypothetical protein